MKGVVLAGGLGTRLNPLTLVTNKHLLPVYDKPMIYYPIQTLVEAGITEALIITSGPHVGHFLGLLKNGKELGLTHIEYAYQDKPNGGIADALALAEDYAGDDPITVILGDNITDASIGTAVENFQDGATIFLQEVEDPQRFGVAVFDPEDPTKIARIDEKPVHPESNMAVTGLYIYDSKVFDYIRQCDPNYIGRNELEITQVNNSYIDAKKMNWATLDGFWSDAGTFRSLFLASAYWASKDQSTDQDIR
jgi:glucose-1-phosphate thymidylyltransferase